MPSLIGRCGGGGGAKIYYARYDSATPIVISSGVATAVTFLRFATNDTLGVALDFGTIVTNLPTLVTDTYMYSLWASVYWPAFGTARTVALATADEEIGWAYPIETTNSEAVQWTGGLVNLDFNHPTHLTLTLTQSSGSNQIIQNATILAQACEIAAS